MMTAMVAAAATASTGGVQQRAGEHAVDDRWGEGAVEFGARQSGGESASGASSLAFNSGVAAPAVHRSGSNAWSESPLGAGEHRAGGEGDGGGGQPTHRRPLAARS